MPSAPLTYSPHTQDAAAPPKRVVVRRTVALRLCPRLYLTLVSKKQVQTSSGADKRALSAQTSPLPSAPLTYTPHTQDAAAPPKRVVVGRTVALRLRPRQYLTFISKKQVQPSSGCRQDGAFGSNLATALCPLYVLAAHPNAAAPSKRVVVGRTVALWLRPCPYLTMVSKKRV
jgi:hypothetical protein